MCGLCRGVLGVGWEKNWDWGVASNLHASDMACKDCGDFKTKNTTNNKQHTHSHTCWLRNLLFIEHTTPEAWAAQLIQLAVPAGSSGLVHSRQPLNLFWNMVCVSISSLNLVWILVWKMYLHWILFTFYFVSMLCFYFVAMFKLTYDI